MPLYRFQAAMAGDTQLPRDRIVNTIHLNDAGLGTDPDSLCTDLLGVLQGFYGTTREMTVTAYVVGPPPQFPVGQAVANSGVAPGSSVPREVALCLSYYAERNLPRQRGRLFLWAGGNTQHTMGLRPSPTIRGFALDLAEAIGNVGGPDVDWVVYSPTDQEARPVTMAWVDDEWDTIRSRGLQASMRDQRALSEA